MIFKKSVSSGISQKKIARLFNKWFDYKKNKNTVFTANQKQTISKNMNIKEIAG